MKCVDCLYYWKEDGEKHPSCKYHYNDGCAPCEIEDLESDENEDEPEQTWEELNFEEVEEK